jgi:hypothetical protein
MEGEVMKGLQAIVRRLPVKSAEGSIDLIEVDAIFYLEAKEGGQIYMHELLFPAGDPVKIILTYMHN